MRRESCHHSDIVIAYESVNKSYIYILNVFVFFHCFLSNYYCMSSVSMWLHACRQGIPAKRLLNSTNVQAVYLT